MSAPHRGPPGGHARPFTAAGRSREDAISLDSDSEDGEDGLQAQARPLGDSQRAALTPAVPSRDQSHQGGYSNSSSQTQGQRTTAARTVPQLSDIDNDDNDDICELPLDDFVRKPIPVRVRACYINNSSIYACFQIKS